MPIRDVGDAIREMRGGSRKIKTRKQAVAVGFKAKREMARRGGRR